MHKNLKLWVLGIFAVSCSLQLLGCSEPQTYNIKIVSDGQPKVLTVSSGITNDGLAQKMFEVAGIKEKYELCVSGSHCFCYRGQALSEPGSEVLSDFESHLCARVDVLSRRSLTEDRSNDIISDVALAKMAERSCLIGFFSREYQLAHPIRVTTLPKIKTKKCFAWLTLHKKSS